MGYIFWLNEIGFSDLVDIIVMSFLLYIVLVWFKKTRAAFVLTGILIIACVYFIARQFNLVLTASVFQGFFAVILVVVVIIFQEELRHFFERVAVLGLKTPIGKSKVMQLSREEVTTLVRTVADFAREKVGALIVLRGKDLIMRHLEGGVVLHGALSEALLKSLFDPHSSGHDGAVIIDENQVSQFGCYLPLSKNIQILGDGGTRHAAALGLSELSDALCLVVSEERGTISVARNGNVNILKNAEELSIFLSQFYNEVYPQREPKGFGDFFRRNYREKGLAFLIAILLWFLHVYGAKVVYKSFVIAVEHAQIPEDLKLMNLEPKEVEVTFSGPRRAFYFLEKNKIRIILKSWQIKEGERDIRLSGSDMTLPKNIHIERIDPTRVRVVVSKE